MSAVTIAALVSSPGMAGSPRPAPESAASCADETGVVERMVESAMQQESIPGLSIAFYKGDCGWSRGFGYADLENDVPASATTVYSLGSVTKTMTALAVMRLVEAGSIDLDQEIRTYVPAYPEKRWPVTVRQLLGHLGGVSHYSGEGLELDGHRHRPHTTDQAVAIFADLPLLHEPGIRFFYSSYGYNLLGAAIEKVSGIAYADYLRKEIWEPLGMRDTRIESVDDLIPRRARGYRLVDGKIKNARPWDPTVYFASGAARSTVVDLMKLSRGLDQGRIVSPAGQQQMYTAMVEPSGRFTDYGMGWDTGYLSGLWLVGHPGGHQGTAAVLLRCPGQRFALAIACNRHAEEIFPLAERILSVLLGVARVGARAAGAEDDRRYDNLFVVWSTGLGYLDRFGQPYTKDPHALAAAFRHVEQAFHEATEPPNLKSPATRKIINGTGPDLPFLAVGSHMASSLAARYGDERLSFYRNANVLPFFADYAALCADGAAPDEPCFSREMADTLATWSRSWQQTWTREVNALALGPEQELAQETSYLQRLFTGRPVIPDLSRQLRAAAELLAEEGETARALATVMAAADLYPRDRVIHDDVGELSLAAGEGAAGVEYFRRRLRNEPDSALLKARLEWFGDTLRALGDPPAPANGIVQACAGEYGDLKHYQRVLLLDGALHYQRGEERVYRLVPITADTFAMSGRERFRVTCQADAAGAVDRIVTSYIDGQHREWPRRLVHRVRDASAGVHQGGGLSGVPSGTGGE